MIPNPNGEDYSILLYRYKDAIEDLQKILVDNNVNVNDIYQNDEHLEKCDGNLCPYKRCKRN